MTLASAYRSIRPRVQYLVWRVRRPVQGALSRLRGVACVVGRAPHRSYSVDTVLTRRQAPDIMEPTPKAKEKVLTNDAFLAELAGMLTRASVKGSCFISMKRSVQTSADGSVENCMLLRAKVAVVVARRECGGRSRVAQLGKKSAFTLVRAKDLVRLQMSMAALHKTHMAAALPKKTDPRDAGARPHAASLKRKKE